MAHPFTGGSIDQYLRQHEAAGSGGDGGGDDEVKLPLRVEPIGGGVGILVDADGVPVVGDDGNPILRAFDEATGGSSSAPSFASSQAAQTQLETFTREQNEANRAFQAEQNRIAEEAATRRDRLGALTRLIESFAGAQSQARDTLANLQPDPFRFAAVAGGIAPFGTTPQQGFTEQLQQFASAPVPTADPNASLPSIESAIQGLTGAQVPLPPTVFGAAGGATIPAPAPGQSVAVKVGEKGEEVLRITAQGVEVIPLSGGMQTGGTIDFPFEPIEFDKETLLPALGTSGIFSGFNQLPKFTPGRPFTGGPSGGLAELGVRPGLVQFSGGNTVFFRDPQTGQLRPFTSLDQFQGAGFDFSNVTQIRAEDRGQFEFGPRLPEGFDPSQSAGTQGTSAFTRFSVPIVEPTTGTILPAPFTVATELNRLRLTNPQTFNLLLSAYTTAGVPAASVLSAIQASLPFGSAGGPVGLR